jgi:phage tail-like protein
MSNAASGRNDPYKNFNFRVTIEGKIVAAVNEASGLSPAPGSPKKRSKKKMPALRKFGNITLKRGLIVDSKLLDWANELSNRPDLPAATLRKNMMLEFCNEAGEVVSSYRVINGWITKIQAPDFNAKANEVAIDAIEISYEGLELIKS